MQGQLEFETEYLHSVAVRLEQESRRLLLLLASASTGSEVLEGQVSQTVDAIDACLELSRRLYGNVREMIEKEPAELPELIRGVQASYGP